MANDQPEHRRTAALDKWRDTREAWPALGIYERFEQLACLILTLLVGVVIADALLRLA